MEKENVLVVDDSPASRARTVEILQRAGYGVFELPSTIGATRSIVRNAVSVAVVDLSASAACSDKLVAALRSTSRLCEVVLLLIGPTSGGERERLERTQGVDAVLGPEELAESLLQTLQHALLMRRLGRSLELIPDVNA